MLLTGGVAHWLLLAEVAIGSNHLLSAGEDVAGRRGARRLGTEEAVATGGGRRDWREARLETLMTGRRGARADG